MIFLYKKREVERNKSQNKQTKITLQKKLKALNLLLFTKTELSLPKNLVKYAIEGRIVFFIGYIWY
jgi:hypothetical protein